MTVKTNLLIAVASSMIFAAGASAQTAPVETTATQTPAAPAAAAPAAPAAAPTTTIAAALPTLPNRATLTKLVTAAKLQTTLAGPGPFTVFAPSDEAFTRLPAGALDTLLKPESAPTLATIIKYHVIAGAVTSDQLKAQITAGGGKATLTTLAGQPLIASLGPNGNIELTDTAGIKSYVDTADIKETNGVVHLTNGMSVPKLG
ncbi:fasciclin domain-containing protein [Sphingomonas faeni]|uniref:fasciclin domain-containing protein n=1 Tax=Sphingomonas faeni TaxID=185950 RepID=UPI003347056D